MVLKVCSQTIKDIEVNVAYKWFLGLDFFDPVPHFSTFGKNYKRRFEDTDLFEQIFANILMQCMKYDLVDPSTIFVDATHVKAAANRKKSKRFLLPEKLQDSTMNNSRTKSMRIAKLMVRNLLRIKKMITAMMIPVIYQGKTGT